MGVGLTPVKVNAHKTNRWNENPLAISGASAGPYMALKAYQRKVVGLQRHLDADHPKMKKPREISLQILLAVHE